MKKTEPNEMAMIHKIREGIAKETQGMAIEELLDYFKRGSGKMRKKFHFTRHLALKKAA